MIRRGAERRQDRPARRDWPYRQHVSLVRVTVCLALVILSATWVLAWADLAWGRTHAVHAQAQVLSKSCHGTKCTAILEYTAPDGYTGEVTFHGVDVSRIHESASGGETADIYFAYAASEWPDNSVYGPPVWLSIPLACLGFGFGIGAIVYLILGHVQAGRRPEDAPVPVGTRLEDSQVIEDAPPRTPACDQTVQDA